MTLKTALLRAHLGSDGKPDGWLCDKDGRILASVTSNSYVYKYPPMSGRTEMIPAPIDWALIIVEMPEEENRAKDKIERLEKLLLEIAGWDIMDTAADGSYWLKRIDEELGL